MRMPRMTTRRWMIAVAIVALAMPIYVMQRRRSGKLLQEAERNARIAAFYQSRKSASSAAYYWAKSARYARAAGRWPSFMPESSD